MKKQVIIDSVYEFLRNLELHEKARNKRNKIQLIKSGSRVLAYLALFPAHSNFGYKIRVGIKGMIPDYEIVNLVYKTSIEIEII